MEKIGGEIKTNENKVNISKTVKTSPQTFGFEIENDSEEDLLKLKPDLLLKEDNRILIVDVACPYDLYLTELYELKVNKYRNLQKFNADKFIPCKVEAIIIGSLRTVHKDALGVLMDTGIPKTKAKGLLKWSSTSCIIGSRQIWNLRCKLVKEQ